MIPAPSVGAISGGEGSEMDLASALFMMIGAWMLIWYVKKAMFGKCSYCGSKDIVPDHGLIFYCNNCRRKG